jgi:hypothetical protein
MDLPDTTINRGSGEHKNVGFTDMYSFMSHLINAQEAQVYVELKWLIKDIQKSSYLPE